MRLLKLKVKNIASLKGEHLIDFAQIQSHSSLFAITGETGAGKSSILNSIGLALYGRIFKTTVNQNDVVTLGEKEGQIELIFEAKGKTYLALWRARVLKANGEAYSTPQSPTREFYQLEGMDFSSTKNIINKRADEILNLDYDQFCKCVILNQGEFAKFLTSSFNERKDILEKLYPGEVLESLSRELKLQMDALFQEKSHLEIELHTLKGDGILGDDLNATFTLLSGQTQLAESWSDLFEKVSYHFTSVQTYHQRYADYQLKKTETTKEFSQETTSYNAILSACELAQAEFKSASDAQEKKLPRLQELLKSEIALNHARTQQMDCNRLIAAQTTKEKDFRFKNEECSSKLELLSNKKKNILSKLHLPLEHFVKIKDQLSEVFEGWNEKSKLDQDILTRQESLSLLEIKGKELAAISENLKKEITELPTDAKAQLDSATLQKKSLSLDLQKRQKAEIKLSEVSSHIHKCSEDIIKLEDSIKTLSSDLAAGQSELTPLETSLKLQEILTAVKVCLLHQESRLAGNCPVCTSPIETSKWDELALVASGNDYAAIESKVEMLKHNAIKLQEGIKSAKIQQKNLLLQLNEKKSEEALLSKELESPVVDFEELEAKITLLQKQVWDLEKLGRERTKTDEELNKTRETYKLQKNDIAAKTQKLNDLKSRLESFEASAKVELVQGLNDQVIQKLKSDLQTHHLYQTEENETQKIEQQTEFIQTNLAELKKEMTSAEANLAQAIEVMTNLELVLKAELGPESATGQIEKLQVQVRLTHQNYEAKNQALKGQESRLKEFRSKLYSYEEQIKDSEILFFKELNEVKAHAVHSLTPLSEEVTQLLKNLAHLTFNLQDPPELLVPIHDLLQTEKANLKKGLNEAKANLSAVKARLEDWDKKQDRIKLLELKREDSLGKYSRLERLSEVLGKDELRSFVLSMVEENLIQQTNQELVRLCQGRYEIIHQTKGLRLTPEFYILDKFREGGRRKVSTLSGGETFMVSLAMALGLAEMTRGQAEIDSLFIDEGFGTLDQECLEDVLEMLGQIQTRGLMVGIISHIKPLTSALAVNLVLSKKNDGTSTVGIRFN